MIKNIQHCFFYDKILALNLNYLFKKMHAEANKTGEVMMSWLKNNLMIFALCMIMPSIASAINVPFYNLNIQPGERFSTSIEITNNQYVQCVAYNINPKNAPWKVFLRDRDPRWFKEGEPVIFSKNNYFPGHFTLRIQDDNFPPADTAIQVTCEYKNGSPF